METGFNLNHWDNVKIELKKKYPQLTGADLIWRHETKEDLLSMLADRLGITKKELEKIIETF